jgi:uncharacterized protein YuzE
MARRSKMKRFNFDYDEKYDDLFVYSDKKSDGSIEIGDFVFDFNNNGKLVAFQIQNASKNLNKISEKPFEDLTKLKDCKIEIDTIKNSLMLKITFILENNIIYSNFVIPIINKETTILNN